MASPGVSGVSGTAPFTTSNFFPVIEFTVAPIVNEHALFRNPDEAVFQKPWPFGSSMLDPPSNPFLFDTDIIGDDGDDTSLLETFLPPQINYKKVNKYARFANDTSDFFNTFYFHPSFGNILLLIGLIAFTLWVIVMNLLTVIGLLRTHRTGHMADLYLANLAVGDTLLGLLILPLMSVVILCGYFPFTKFVCDLWVFLDYYLIVAASFGSCAMMCNYLWMIRWPHTFPTDARHHVVAIGVCWMAVNFSWTPSFFNDRLSTLYPLGHCGFSISRNQYFSFYIGISGFYIPLAISLICGILSLAGLKTKSRIPRLSWRQSLFIGRRRRSSRFANEVILDIDVEGQQKPKSKLNKLELDTENNSRPKTPKFFGPGAAAECDKNIGTGNKMTAKTKKRPQIKQLTKQRSITSATDPKMISQMAKDHYPLVVTSLVLFIICRSLFYVYFGVGSFVPNFFPLDLSNGVYWLMHSNAAISPLIHLAFDPELREEVGRMLGIRINAQRTPIVTPEVKLSSPITSSASTSTSTGTNIKPKMGDVKNSLNNRSKDSTISNLSHFSVSENRRNSNNESLLPAMGTSVATLKTENEISGRLANVDVNKKPQVQFLDVDKLGNGIE